MFGEWNALSEPETVTKGWEAYLALDFAVRQAKTVLVQRKHHGPLIVQRPFYPEGGVCHVYLLHPPGGVVSGDFLQIEVSAANASQVLLTTPAAGKFYRSSGDSARQSVSLKIAADATLEWLPQETIVYEGAKFDSSIEIALEPGARFLGWEILVLGRPAADEGFKTGLANLRWKISRGSELLFLERMQIDAEAFAARWGLNNHSTCATLIATPATQANLEAVQLIIGEQQGRGVTRMDDLLICRALDTRADRLREFFQQVWITLRPSIVRREVCVPRIWAT